MSLHDDLLKQAIHLATVDRRRPKQVNLRRAVSASYYALFHLLTSEASGLYVNDDALLARINRTYNHGDLKKVSILFVNNRLPKAIQPSSGGFAFQPELQNVASVFLNLQQARHAADYDLERIFSRREALGFSEQVQRAFANWKAIKKADNARLYLACFLLWKRWDENPR